MKKILVLTGLVILVAGVVYYSFQKKKADDWEKKKKIWEFNEETAYKWEVNYDGFHMACEKKGSRYFLSAPEKREVTKNAFLVNVKNFNSCEYVSIVSESTNDESTWGIDRSQSFSIYFLDRKGRKSSFTLFRGAEAKAPKGYYVVAAHENRVYSVEHWVIAALAKTREDMYELAFLGLDPDEILYLSLPHLRVVKSGLYYEINGEKKENLDTRRVDDLIETVGFLRADAVLSREQAKKMNLSQATFSKAMKVEVIYKKKAAAAGEYQTPLARDLPAEGTRIFYVKREGDLSFAKLSENPLIYQIADKIRRDLERPFDFYLLDERKNKTLKEK